MIEPQLSLPDSSRVLWQVISKLFGSLFNGNRTQISALGGVNVLVIDSQGRQSGYQDGQAFNEIPDVTVAKSSSSQLFTLPSEGAYAVRITPFGNSTASRNIDSTQMYASITLTAPFSSTAAYITDFDKFELAPNTYGTIEYSNGHYATQMVLSQGATINASSDEIVDASAYLSRLFLPLLTK
ncbi:MAG: hypothetical protein KatS3mg087_0257 [Patescibacteria group bacterium]|nr:MAG: hypothetical protein KatS3mg087_0257 [Patescibacteria group bacterium]